jgi:nucleotide-binding universal stress UspA family protein
MYRKIVVPVVTPVYVEPLVKLASRLLEPDGEVHILNVIHEVSMPEIAKGWRSSLHIVIPAHEAAAALDIKVVPEVVVAQDIAIEILERAEALAADAILMTLTADPKHRHKIFGHTSSAILNHASCDVLIVNPLALSATRAAKIILPTLTVQPPPKTMQVAETLSTELGKLPIVTLHMRSGSSRSSTGTSGHEFQRTHGRVPRVLKTVLFPARFFHSNALLPTAILNEVRKEGYGLCIVGDEGRGLGREFVTRPFLEELFAISPCPILVLRGA